MSKETREIYNNSVIPACDSIVSAVEVGLKYTQKIQAELQKGQGFNLDVIRQPIEQGMTFGKEPPFVAPGPAAKILKGSQNEGILRQYYAANQERLREMRPQTTLTQTQEQNQSSRNSGPKR